VHQVGFYYIEVFNHIESVPTNVVEIIPFVLEITNVATARNFQDCIEDIQRIGDSQ